MAGDAAYEETAQSPSWGGFARMAWAVCCCAFGAAVFVAGLRSPEGISPDAAVWEGICAQLLAGTTEGRQALVSSLWWPPLPVLLRLPLAAVVGGEAYPVVSLLVSAAFGAGVLVLLESVLRGWRFGWARFAVVAAVAAHPAFGRACASGGSGTTMAFLVVGTAFSLTEWVARRKTRFLICTGMGSALLVWMGHEAILWLAAVYGLLALDLLFAPTGPSGRFTRSQKEATLILGCLPPLYTFGLWVLLNWLVMGDALYFVRSLTRGVAGVGEAAGGSLPPLAWGGPADVLYGVATVLAGLPLAVAAFRSNRAAAFLGALGVAPVAAALFLAERGYLWDPDSLFLCLTPLAAVSLGFCASADVAGNGSAVRALAKTLAVAAIGGLTLAQWPAAPRPATAGASLSAAVAESPALRMERHLRSRSPYAKVFVCGYEGFRLVGFEGESVFAHSLDFDFAKAKNDYYGHRLFLLIHRPVGRSAVDSVHWKYPGIYRDGCDSTLHDEDWGDWRLFEIVQAPRDRKPGRGP